MLGFAVASVACVYAPSIEALVIWRFFQAMMGCAGMVIARAIVRDLCRPQEMARVLSLLILVMGIAPILAPLLGSISLKYFDWQSLFGFLAAFGASCALLVIGVVPETLPTERRESVLSFPGAWRNYRQVIGHKRFMGYALAGGVAQAGMFSYISASSFVFIGSYGFTSSQFAMLFSSNAFGLILASQINRAALSRFPAQRVLGLALETYSVSALLMVLAASTGWGGAVSVIVPLWICLACLGFTFPNSTAAAMAPFGDRAGTASALMGTMQFTIAGLASAAVGHYEGNGAVPMASMMATCAVTAWLLLRWVRRQV
jgi:DHA1 family bicyclomycin/chloramphenicol resistance-like MFS transporter